MKKIITRVWENEWIYVGWLSKWFRSSLSWLMLSGKWYFIQPNVSLTCRIKNNFVIFPSHLNSPSINHLMDIDKERERDEKGRRKRKLFHSL